MKGLSSAALEHMIDFIYTGEMELDYENLLETLNAASHLQVSHLSIYQNVIYSIFFVYNYCSMCFREYSVSSTCDSLVIHWSHSVNTFFRIDKFTISKSIQ